MLAASRTGVSGLALVVLGWVTIAFWLSMAVLPQVIPPLSRWPDWAGFLDRPEIAGVPSWMRQRAGLDRPEGEIVAALNRQLAVTYAFDWALILAGTASGVLLIRRRRAGWWMALAMSSGLLAVFLADESYMLAKYGRGYLKIWAAVAHYAPRVAARGVINVLFCVVAILVLMLARRGYRER